MSESILKQKIVSLPFTAELKKVLSTGGVENLEDLLQVEVYNWHNKYRGFNYHHQQEIVKYLEQNKLLRYLKED